MDEQTSKVENEITIPPWDILRESCIFSDLLSDPVDLSVNEDGGDGVGRGKGLENAENQWFACILWDSHVAQEFESHEEFKCELYTTMFLGRLMSNKLRGNEELGDNAYWEGIQAMDWRKPFIMVDIISGEFGRCGIYPCLRVQEVNTINSRLVTGEQPAIWDLVIYKECQPLATEMVRRFKDGVKTTVVIWSAYKSVYKEQPWVDGEENVRGEIFLKATKSKGDKLSVLIFHREYISKERRYRILEANKDSELWSGFQNNDLGYSWFCYSSSGGRRKENHLALHVIKKKRNGGGRGIVDKGEVEECENGCDLSVQSFPNSTFNSTISKGDTFNDTIKVDVGNNDNVESQYNFTRLLEEL